MKKIARLLVCIALTVGLIGTFGMAQAGAQPVAAVTYATAKVDPTLLVDNAQPVTISKHSVKLAKRCKIHGRVLCIDKTRRKTFFVKNGKVLKTMDARFGCSNTRTRQGTFHVYRKNRHWVSTIYHTSMPFSMFFSGGQAVHYSSDFAARGYAGCSHGCVNIRKKSTIRWVFARIHVGDRVVVYRS